jgi:photosystem II stability/assembly factor-like uncharacterized protein
MNMTSRMLLLSVLVLVAGCSSSSNPVAPVSVPPLSSLTLTPKADTLTVGGTAAFTATALDTLGQPYAGGGLLWSTSDAGVFTVTSAGVVTARGEGTATLAVSGGGRRDTALVLVYPHASGWFAQTSNASESLEGVFFDPAGRLGWVVGGGGVVLNTTDAGETWSRRMPTTFDLNAVWFTSALEGWAVGKSGTVLHTLDGGTSWSRSISTNTSSELRGVTFAARDTGWAVGGGGLVLWTTDRGAHWQKSFAGTGSALNEVRFSGPDGWAVGDGGVVAGSHDRGLTWFVVQPAITTQTLRGLWRSGPDSTVAVGLQGVVASTVVTPDSTTWVLGPNVGFEFNLDGVCFPTLDVGYAAGWNVAGGTVLRSDDGGWTWRAQDVSSQFHLKAVYFVDGLRGWAVGENGTIRHTVSGGD